MNFNLSTWSIKHPVPTYVIFLTLTILGISSFLHLGIDETPNVDVPIVSVTVTQLGAAPFELETQVTKKIEDAIAPIERIKHIYSTINDGISSTMVEFELGVDIDRATNDVRDAVSKTRQQLPLGIDEPIVQRVDFVGGPFVNYVVSSTSLSPKEISDLIDNKISRDMLSIKGVGKVERSGGMDREIRINLDPDRLAALDLTVEDINNQIKAQNINLPGGRGELGQSEQSIRTIGSAYSIEELSQKMISLADGRFVRLNTLGTIEDGASDPRQMALLDGEQVVTFSLIRSVGSNLVTVDKLVKEKLKVLKKELPTDIKITEQLNTVKYVRDSYDASLESLLCGAALAILVIVLFLKDIKAALIAGIAMPLSLIPTFWVMDLLNFTLNNMSMLALALVTGILVDDAIVEIENIVRHQAMGKTPYQAAIDAAEEIGLAVIATTMTIIVVFVPVAFMGGIAGQFFKQFGLTVAIAVFFSLLVARMITPLICAYLLRYKAEQEPPKFVQTMMSVYDQLLQKALVHRLSTILIALAVFIGSIVLFKLMPTSLFGNADRSLCFVTVELPPGATISDTKDTVEQVTKIIKAHKEVDNVFAIIGSGSDSQAANVAGPVNKANVYVNLIPKDKRKLSQKEIETALRPELLKVAGARISFSRVGGGPGGKDLKLIFTGADPEQLKANTEELTDQIRQIKGIGDITNSAAISRPEILVQPDLAKAAEQGVSVLSIARTALIATLGDANATLAKFNLSDRQINIRVQLNPKVRNDFQTIANLKLKSNSGNLIPLDAVAAIKFGDGPMQIDRFDRQRQVSIEASLEPELTLGDALKKIHNLPAFKALPADIKEQPAGDAEIQKDVFGGFTNAISSAILLIYAVLVLLFSGFLQPLTIMMSLPLALGGALLFLLATGKPVGMFALIGIVMLMGLVTKNAILLVEYGLSSQKDGQSAYEAMQIAASVRMRPILMTTVAMIAGMLPIALAIGAGAEVRSPMAIAVIGGLVASTLLTLVVIPVVYTYVEDFQHFLYRHSKLHTFLEAAKEHHSHEKDKGYEPHAH